MPEWLALIPYIQNYRNVLSLSTWSVVNDEQFRESDSVSLIVSEPGPNKEMPAMRMK